MRDEKDFSHLRETIQRYCKPRLAEHLPIMLMTTADRWNLGHYVISGPHEANMAMWSQPFPGGVMLADYIFSHAEKFTGKKLIDVGTGSGLVAIAAAKVGADVTAIDSSFYAVAAATWNAELNNVAMRVLKGGAQDFKDFLEDIFPSADIITAADIFNVHPARKETADLLNELAQEGKTVYATSHDEDLEEILVGDAKAEVLNPCKFIILSQSNVDMKAAAKGLTAPANTRIAECSRPIKDVMMDMMKEAGLKAPTQ